MANLIPSPACCRTAPPTAPNYEHQGFFVEENGMSTCKQSAPAHHQYFRLTTSDRRNGSFISPASHPAHLRYLRHVSPNHPRCRHSRCASQLNLRQADKSLHARLVRRTSRYNPISPRHTRKTRIHQRLLLPKGQSRHHNPSNLRSHEIHEGENPDHRVLGHHGPLLGWKNCGTCLC